MANVILTNAGGVTGPAYPAPAEEPVMEGAAIFPRWYYAAAVPAGRVFEDECALDAASSEGPWYTTPQEAQEAAAREAPDEPDAPPRRRTHR